MAAACLFVSTNARADEVGYRISKDVATAGLVMGGAGPLLAGAGTILLVGSIDGERVDATGVSAGAVVAAAGVGVTALAPAILVGGGIGGNLSLKDMGRAGPLTGAYIGLGGIALQAGGWALTATNLSNGEASASGFALRVVGWTTGMVGGVVQFAGNGKTYRSGGTAAAERLGGVQVALVPTSNGARLLGTF